MNKLMKSGLIILAVAAIAGYATYSYFSDTETSTGNTFTAGAIDLSDNLSTVRFDLVDMKPGDMDEDKFDITATSNPYWACMRSTIDTTPENDANEPEVAAGDSSSSTVGELQNYLSFYVWNDRDGNGEYNGNGNNFPDPSANPNVDRNLAGPFTLSQMQALGYMPLADNSALSFFGPTALLAGQTYNLGYAYCFGTPSHNSYSNITCSGEGDENNVAQTDGVTGTIEFYAVQSRNNDGFNCASMNPVFVLTDASEQNALNAVSLNKPWYTYEIDGLCIDFTLHNPTSSPAYFDYAINGDPGYSCSATGIIAHEGPFNGLDLGNCHINNTNVPAGQTVTVNRCGNSEIKIAIHYGPEQNWYLDWATFTAQ